MTVFSSVNASQLQGFANLLTQEDHIPSRPALLLLSGQSRVHAWGTHPLLSQQDTLLQQLREVEGHTQPM